MRRVGWRVGPGAVAWVRSCERFQYALLRCWCAASAWQAQAMVLVIVFPRSNARINARINDACAGTAHQSVPAESTSLQSVWVCRRFPSQKGVIALALSHEGCCRIGLTDRFKCTLLNMPWHSRTASCTQPHIKSCTRRRKWLLTTRRQPQPLASVSTLTRRCPGRRARASASGPVGATAPRACAAARQTACC